MRHQRIKKMLIKDAAQLRVLSSPVTFEIVQTLRHSGAATVNELGPKLGRKANSLHYHIRKLLRAGIIKKIATQKSFARTETVYDVVAESFYGPTVHEDPKLQKLTNDGIAALLRLANRNVRKAIENPVGLVEYGAERNILTQRRTARLNKTQLAEINALLERLDEILSDNTGSEDGRLFSLTVVLTPIVESTEDK